jgi:hypothetical protein
MAITFTPLTGDNSTTDSTIFDTASFTPAANRLILLALGIGDTEGDDTNGITAEPTVTGCNLTWVRIPNIRSNGASTSSTGRSVILWRAMGANPTTDDLVFDFGATIVHSIDWSVVQVNGTATTGTNGSGAIRIQSSGNEGRTNSGSGTSGSVTLDTFQGSGSAAFAAFLHNANETSTPGSGFTEFHNRAVGAPSLGLLTEGKINDNTVDASWATSTEWGVVAVEIVEPTTTPLVGTLVDRFDNATVGPPLFVAHTQQGSTVTETDSEVRFNLAVNPTVSTAFTDLNAGPYSLIGSSIYWSIKEMPGPNGRFYVRLLNTTQARYVSIESLYATGEFIAHEAPNNTLVTLPWDDNAMRFCRIRESGGTVFFETSPDASTWTTRATRVTDVDISNFTLEFGGSSAVGATAPGRFVASGINVVDIVGRGRQLIWNTIRKAEHLVDDFADGARATFWNLIQGTGTTAAESNNHLVLTLAADNASERNVGYSYNAYTTAPLEFRNSHIYIGVPQVPSLGGNLHFWVQTSDDAQGIAMTREPTGELGFRRRSNGGTSELLGSLTYDPEAHRFWRLRHSGSTFFWDTSPDGTTWTNRHSNTHPTWDGSAAGPEIVAFNEPLALTPGVARISGVNIVDIAGRSRQLVWNTNASTVVGKSLGLQWNTTDVTQVGKSLGLPWGVATTVGKAVNLRWASSSTTGLPGVTAEIEPELIVVDPPGVYVDPAPTPILSATLSDEAKAALRAAGRIE